MGAQGLLQGEAPTSARGARLRRKAYARGRAPAAAALCEAIARRRLDADSQADRPAELAPFSQSTPTPQARTGGKGAQPTAGTRKANQNPSLKTAQLDKLVRTLFAMW